MDSTLMNDLSLKRIYPTACGNTTLNDFASNLLHTLLYILTPPIAVLITLDAAVARELRYTNSITMSPDKVRLKLLSMSRYLRS